MSSNHDAYPTADLSLAVIGAGAIGRVVCEEVLAGKAPRLRLAGVLTRTGATDLPVGATRYPNVEALCNDSPSIVVEAASHDAVRTFGERILQSGSIFVCTSVGALAEQRFLDRLQAAARDHATRIIIPSGAAGALDVLRAATIGGLDSVDVRQCKPASTLLAANEAEQLRVPKVVFAGTAHEAIRLYPRTTNVLAAIALAGVGVSRTSVEIVADPTIDANQLTVQAAGLFGSFAFTIANRPSKNPRTSAITADSVIASLRTLAGVLTLPG